MKKSAKIIIYTALLILGFDSSAFARNYSVLAVRVDFPYEDPDHDTTSGRGKFDLRNYYNEKDPVVREQYYHPWDVPPHNKQYFENHLKALGNYWQTVSEGRVTITYEVWPSEPDSAYTLSNKFYKYGNGRTKEQTYEKLTDLLREALATCKQKEGGKVDFSAFDTFMVIHAGVGSETSGNLNDIPSAYITKEDIEKYLGTSFVIDNSEIDNGIVVPEMTSSNGFGGLNGIMAQMFGHHLGLPSLSNNKDGLPASGGWCLMDTGSMAYGHGTRGFVPTHPCIWSKIELRWIEPITVTADTSLTVAATHIDSGLPRAVKVPISPDEYLLIENRIRYVPRDSLATATFSDSDTSGVWMQVDHYDAYIPGSGILIWHINNRIIDDYRSEDAINNDIYRRGIDLLEADGRQDIGAYIGFGDPRGEYTEGHDDDTFKLSGINTISPLTNPNSGSMWGGNSGITIRINSDPGDTMSVSINFTGNMKGFPLHIGNNGNITAVDMNRDGIDELIVSAGDSSGIISAKGEFIIPFQASNHPSVAVNGKNDLPLMVTTHGSSIYLYTFSNNHLFSSVSSGDAAGTYSISYDYNLVTSETQDSAPTALIFARNVDDSGATLSSYIEAITDMNTLLPVMHVAFPDTVHIKSIAAAYYEIAALGTNNVLYTGNLYDEILQAYPLRSQTSFGPVMADLNRDNVYETIVTSDKNILIYQPDGSYTSVSLPYEPIGDPSVADIDSDGYPEIIQCAGKGIFAFRHDGVPVNGFPYMIPPGDTNEQITSPPLVADLNNDGNMNIAFATSNMRLISFDSPGILTPGFPLCLRGMVEHTPLIFKCAAPDSIAIACVTTDGMVLAYNLGTTTGGNNGMWPMWKGDPGLRSSLLNSDIPSGIKTTASFEAYCYPNPITGGTGTFRIIPTNTTDCIITLYTVDGKKVFDHRLSEGEVIPGVPNEVRLNATKLASGLYIAKIETRQKTIFYKVGVLK